MAVPVGIAISPGTFSSIVHSFGDIGFQHYCHLQSESHLLGNGLMRVRSLVLEPEASFVCRVRNNIRAGNVVSADAAIMAPRSTAYSPKI